MLFLAAILIACVFAWFCGDALRKHPYLFYGAGALLTIVMYVLGNMHLQSIAARKKAFPERDRVTMIAGNALEDGWCARVNEILAGRKAKPVFLAEGLFMYLTLAQIRTFLEILKRHFPDGGTLIAEQNSKLMQKNEKHHDTVKNTNAHFRSGTDSAQEIADLTSGFRVIEEHSFNEEMRKYSIRAKLFAALLPKMNDRWATFRW